MEIGKQVYFQRVEHTVNSPADKPMVTYTQGVPAIVTGVRRAGEVELVSLTVFHEGRIDFERVEKHSSTLGPGVGFYSEKPIPSPK